MAFTVHDVVEKAVILGKVATEDMERLEVTSDMIVTKVSIYLGYDCTTVDGLLNILAEISVKQLALFKDNLATQENEVKKLTRGDYSIEYSTSEETNKERLFEQYTWILNKFRKLRTL